MRRLHLPINYTFTLLAIFLIALSSCKLSGPRFRIIEGPDSLKIMDKWIELNNKGLNNFMLGHYIGGFAQDRPHYYFKFNGPSNIIDELVAHFSLNKGDWEYSPCSIPPQRFIKELKSWWLMSELETDACYTGNPKGHAGCRVDFAYDKITSTGYLSIMCG